MKLVEKKCPKCGADLSFDRTSKEVSCKYCNTSFEVYKDTDDIVDTVSDMIDPDIFQLHAKMFKNFGKLHTAVFIFVFAVAIIIFIIVAFNMFSRF
ncbi:MAG: hypothetical protein IKH36_03285 [Bacilli bacterium]|nr:hypothetical protein [Bacilli bacterium]